MLKFSKKNFSPQVTNKFWKKILNIQENSIWLKWFFKLFIWQTFFEACYQGMFFLKLINYLTNIGITIYDIIIRCKVNPSPPKKKNFGGYPRKNLPIQIFL
jgi:hypothetical protein